VFARQSTAYTSGGVMEKDSAEMAEAFLLSVLRRNKTLTDYPELEPVLTTCYSNISGEA